MVTFCCIITNGMFTTGLFGRSDMLLVVTCSKLELYAANVSKIAIIMKELAVIHYTVFIFIVGVKP